MRYLTQSGWDACQDKCDARPKMCGMHVNRNAIPDPKCVGYMSREVRYPTQNVWDTCQEKCDTRPKMCGIHVKRNDLTQNVCECQEKCDARPKMCGMHVHFFVYVLSHCRTLFITTVFCRNNLLFVCVWIFQQQLKDEKRGCTSTGVYVPCIYTHAR